MTDQTVELFWGRWDPAFKAPDIVPAKCLIGSRDVNRRYLMMRECRGKWERTLSSSSLVGKRPGIRNCGDEAPEAKQIREWRSVKPRPMGRAVSSPCLTDEGCEWQEAQKTLKKTGHQNWENQTSFLFCFVSGPSFKSKYFTFVYIGRYRSWLLKKLKQKQNTTNLMPWTLL